MIAIWTTSQIWKKIALQLMVIVKDIYENFSNVLKGFSSCVIDDVSELFLTFKNGIYY